MAKKTNEELIALLKKEGMTDEEIAELGNSPEQMASLKKQHEKKVILIEFEIPEGNDREISPEEFQAIMAAAGNAVQNKMLTSTALSIAGSVGKAAFELWLNKQTAGIAGAAAAAAERATAEDG